MTSTLLDNTNFTTLLEVVIKSLERFSKTDKEFRKKGGSENTSGPHTLSIYKHNDGSTQIVCKQEHAKTLNSTIALNVAKARYHEDSEKYVVFFAFDFAHFGKGVTSSFRVGFKSVEDAASFLTIYNENCECKCGNVCEICATTPSTKLEEVASNDEDEDTAKPTIAKSVTDLCSDSEEDSESEEDSDSEEGGEIPSDADEGSEASDRSYYLEDDFANSQAMPDFDDLAIINDLRI